MNKNKNRNDYKNLDVVFVNELENVDVYAASTTIDSKMFELSLEDNGMEIEL